MDPIEMDKKAYELQARFDSLVPEVQRIIEQTVGSDEHLAVELAQIAEQSDWLLYLSGTLAPELSKQSEIFGNTMLSMCLKAAIANPALGKNFLEAMRYQLTHYITVCEKLGDLVNQ